MDKRFKTRKRGYFYPVQANNAHDIIIEFEDGSLGSMNMQELKIVSGYYNKYQKKQGAADTARIEATAVKVVGKEFKTNKCGPLVVTEFNGCMDVKVRFVETGYETTVALSNIKKGKVYDWYHPNVYGKAWHGVGEYSRGSSKWHKKIYLIWNAMIQRTCPDQKGFTGATVCDEWLDFQNYAKWYEDNHKEGWDVDKDVLGMGKKHYSPETCIFLHPDVNVSIGSFDNTGVRLVTRTNGDTWRGFDGTRACKTCSTKKEALNDVFMSRLIRVSSFAKEHGTGHYREIWNFLKSSMEHAAKKEYGVEIKLPELNSVKE